MGRSPAARVATSPIPPKPAGPPCVVKVSHHFLPEYSPMPTLSHILARGALAAALFSPLAASGQESGIEPRPLGPGTRSGEPRFMGGLSFSVGDPKGEFKSYVDQGFGLGGHGLARLGSEGVFAIRLDAGFLNYGNETIRLPLSAR